MATLGPKEKAVNSFPSWTEGVSAALIPSPRSSDRNCCATVARMETVKVRSRFSRTVAFIICNIARNRGKGEGCPSSPRLRRDSLLCAARRGVRLRQGYDATRCCAQLGGVSVFAKATTRLAAVRSSEGCPSSPRLRRDSLLCAARRGVRLRQGYDATRCCAQLGGVSVFAKATTRLAAVRSSEGCPSSPGLPPSRFALWRTRRRDSAAGSGSEGRMEREKINAQHPTSNVQRSTFKGKGFYLCIVNG